MKGSLAAVKDVSVIIDGVAHNGTYYVQDTMVHVQSPLGTKSTWIGLSHPHAIAKLLLSELVRRPKASRPFR